MTKFNSLKFDQNSLSTQYLQGLRKLRDSSMNTKIFRKQQDLQSKDVSLDLGIEFNEINVEEVVPYKQLPAIPECAEIKARKQKSVQSKTFDLGSSKGRFGVELVNLNSPLKHDEESKHQNADFHSVNLEKRVSSHH